MNQFDELEGTFNPVRTDDLVGSAKDFIGITFTWQAVWVVESGPYEGEWAMMPVDSEGKQLFGWTPESDIDFINKQQ